MRRRSPSSPWLSGTPVQRGTPETEESQLSCSTANVRCAGEKFTDYSDMVPDHVDPRGWAARGGAIPRQHSGLVQWREGIKPLPERPAASDARARSALVNTGRRMQGQMAKDPFVVAASHLCNSHGKSLSEIARKCGWSELQVRALFQPGAKPSDRMLKDLARELQVEITVLRKISME